MSSTSAAINIAHYLIPEVQSTIARTIPWAFLVLSLAGCGQTLKEGIEAVCEAPRHICDFGCTSDPPDEVDRAKGISIWLERKVHNKEAEQFLQELTVLPFGQRAKLLRAEATKFGIAETDCPMIPLYTLFGIASEALPKR